MDDYQVEGLNLLVMERRSKILPSNFWGSIQVSGKCPGISDLKSVAHSAVSAFLPLVTVGQIWSVPFAKMN